LENLIDCINAFIHTLAWTPQMAFDYFRMVLHSSAENWIKLVCETKEEFQPSWNYIKPLFKERFGKKMVVAKIGTVLDNLKMDPNDLMDEFSAKMNANFCQLRELIPKGGKLSTFQNNQQTGPIQSVKESMTTPSSTPIYNTLSFFIAGQPEAIMTLVASKDPMPSPKHVKKPNVFKN